jgi:hypothetical protein
VYYTICLPTLLPLILLFVLVAPKTNISINQSVILTDTLIAMTKIKNCQVFFLIRIVGSGVQLGPLGTLATNRPIVTAPGDYDDAEIGAMMIGSGTPKYSEKTCPSAALSALW